MVIEAQSIQWGSRELQEADRGRLRCGRLLVEYSGGEDGVCLASTRMSEEAFEKMAEDGAVDWTHWAVCTGTDEIDLSPGLPDLPVLLIPQWPFDVASGAEERVFFRLPVSVVVRAFDPFDEVLAELSTVSLPRVRFGDDEAGELCYRLDSEAHREAPGEPDQSAVVAPVTIRNDSRETLSVRRLCLRVPGLSVYSGSNGLWTNETLIRYQGGRSRSRVAVENGAPTEAAGSRVVAGPRRKAPVNVMGRTFRSPRRWKEDLLDVS